MFSLYYGIIEVFSGKLAGIAIDPTQAFILSVFRTGITILLSSIIGVFLGFTFYVFGQKDRYVTPYFNFIRSIPITFLIPILSWVPGLSRLWLFPIILASIPCSLMIAVGINERAHLIDPDRMHVAKILLGRKKWLKFGQHFLFWELLPGFIVGLQTAIPYAAILIGVVEYVGIGQQPGFGNLVAQGTANDSGEPSFPLIAAIALYGMFGLLLLWSAKLLLKMGFDTVSHGGA